MKHLFSLIRVLAAAALVLGTAPLSAQLSTTPTVVERGLNHQVWQRLAYVTNPVTGNVATRTNQYVQLSSGLHYRGDNGELLETKELIQPAAGGAVAHEGPHKVAFALNANTRGAIQYVSADGERLESHVIGLVMTDATGKSVMLATIKDSIGQLTAPNQVTYPDAFTGLRADIRYTYRKFNFEQDVILRQQIDPQALGLDPKTAVLQVFTEWLDYPDKVPPPGKTNAFLQAQPGERLMLGGIRFGRSRAFVEDEPLLVDGKLAKRIQISKAFERRDGRDFLIESAKYSDLKEALAKLPKQQAAVGGAGQPNRAVAGLKFPAAPIRLRADDDPPIEVALNRVQPNDGLVLDYTLIYCNTNDYTFTNGTYRISGAFVLSGTTKIESGAVLKYEPGAGLWIYDSLEFQTQPEASAVFTSVYDNEVGENLGIGNPLTQDFTPLAFDGTNALVLKNARFRYAYIGCDYWSLDYPLLVTNAQFEFCTFGLWSESMPAHLFNALFSSNTYALFLMGGGTGHQLTVVNSSFLDIGFATWLTNSLLVDVANPDCAGTDHTVITTNAAAIFQAGPLGSYYLVPGQTNLINAGSLSAADAGLYHFTTATNQLPETNSTVDLGWHYLAVNTSTNAVDTDGDGLPDYAEDANGNGQFDTGETDFNDYFNGALPTLAIESGNNQSAYLNTWLAQTLVVSAKDSNNNALVNAPLTFTISQGGGGLAASTNGTPGSSLDLRTDANGQAAVYLKLPGSYSASNGVTVTAVIGTNSTQTTFTEFIDKVATPTGSPAGGTHTLAQVVTINCATTNASLYYTLDGSEPTESDNLIAAGSTLTIWRTTTLKVKAFKPNYVPSDTQSAAYTISGSMAAGYYHSLASGSDGNVRAWGFNGLGQLGDGTTTNRSTPIQTTNLSNVIATAGGAFHSLGRKSDGTVWTWGYNSYGQLGDGTTTNLLSPVQTTNLSNAVAVAAGGYKSLAVKSDGTAWAWGYNICGQLGDGTTTQRLTPIQVTNLTNVAAIGAGYYHSLAVKSDGTAWAWGYNNVGQLGDGTTTNRSTPVQVTNLTNIVAVAGGYYHSLALKSDGTVWAWGFNNYGQLGNGTNTNRSTPVQVSNLSNIMAVAAGDYHSLVTKADGTVWAWGYNYYGQLGDGSNTNRWTPVQVANLTNMVAAAGGHYHSLALKSDGTVWAWGYNNFGQLGDGTTTNRTTPVQVQDLRLLNWDDADGDGLPTWRELELGTNPDLADSDYDGRSDGQEVTDSTDPLNAANFTEHQLGYWRFDTANLPGDQGQLPIYTNGLNLVASWNTNAVEITTNANAGLVYRETETNGTPNINCRNGTIRFWFKPNWSSTNQEGGTGPQTWARLIELGYYTETSLGQWVLAFNPEGTQLILSGASDGQATNYLTADVSFASNEWHQIVLTYTPTNSALYLDGQLATNGTGSVLYPEAGLRHQGFRIGNDSTYTTSINGQFDELETLNHPLSASAIATNYQNLATLDSDSDGLTDIVESQFGTNPNSADTDGDGLSDSEEVILGTDPTKANQIQPLLLRTFTPLK
jgi:alpha-tubulin suppressor-like RCC1 family protein